MAALHDSVVDGEVHIPTFARRALERLAKEGLLHAPDNEPFANVRRVTCSQGGKEQDIWIMFDTRRADAGYLAVEVVDTPRSDSAILAAMTAVLAEPVDFGQVLEALSSLRFEGYREQDKTIDEAHSRRTKREEVPVGEAPRGIEELLERVAAQEAVQPLQYILPLLSYYKPEFDSYTLEEQRALLEKTCRYINDFLESLRKLRAFLEYGAPSRKLTPAIKEPRQAVKAAVLRDVDGLSYREIGERLRISLHPNYKVKGEHQTVRKIVGRGKEMLESAFGEEGWRDMVKVMKAEKARWCSLSSQARHREVDTEMTARDLNISIEEVRRREKGVFP